MNKFIHLRPMLWTEQLEETILFYQKLGFICGEKNEEWGWAALHRDDVEIMLAKPNAHENFQQPKFTGSFYIQVENVDQLWKELKNNCRVCYKIDNFDWEMREFAIYDNNGYILQFGTPI